MSGPVKLVSERLADALKMVAAILKELVPLLEGIDLNPAVSMGLALYPSEADSLEALMRLADADMYEHKKRRRCRNGTETSPSADGASCGAGV